MLASQPVLNLRDGNECPFFEEILGYDGILELYMLDVRPKTARYREFEKTRIIIENCIHLISNECPSEELESMVRELRKTPFNRMFPQTTFTQEFRENLRNGLIRSILAANQIK